MKVIDKLLLIHFVKYLVLTFCTALFVLLLQFFLVYLDVLLGKGLTLSTYGKLAYHVSILATKQAFPIAILLSSIMALGVLGERHELIALKSAGISLLRVVWPLCCLALLISACLFVSNSYFVPRAYLRTYNLLYDINKKKPAIAIREGIFYDGIPGYSIRIDKKLRDQETLQGIMIYDHTRRNGDVVLITADSGRIYTTDHETYLAIELYNGHYYMEVASPTQGAHSPSRLHHSSFSTQTFRINLASLQLSETDPVLFSGVCGTKNIQQLTADIVAMRASLQQKPSQGATSAAQHLERNIRKHVLARHKMFTWAVSCFIMCLLGASIGIIVSKGGVGISLAITMAIVTWHYLFEVLGDRWAQEGVIAVWLGAWLANHALLPLIVCCLRLRLPR
jgi:lipopolysaccharide export system permease protein